MSAPWRRDVAADFEPGAPATGLPLPDIGDAAPQLPGAPSLLVLFQVCVRVGLLSFGGGLSGWLYQEFVARTRWISDEDFASSLAISQMLPGPNVVNLLICMGDQLRGVLGSVTCVSGLLVGPFFAVIALSASFDRVADLQTIQIVAQGVAFAAIGLLLLICLRGVQRAMRFPPFVGIIAGTAIAVGLLQWPLIAVVLVAAPVGVAMAWRRL